jgi:hypothetical protein
VDLEVGKTRYLTLEELKRLQKANANNLKMLQALNRGILWRFSQSTLSMFVMLATYELGVRIMA